MTRIEASTEPSETESASSPDWLFDAFVSYRRSDGRSFTKWLRRVLEGYRLPKVLRTSDKQLRLYLDTAFERPVDFWKDNIEPSLSRSRFLLVVITESVFLTRPDGSPNWVVQEIEYFARLPQGSNVVAITLAGDPNGPLPGSLRDRFPRLHVIDMRRFRPGLWAMLTRRRLKDHLIPVIGTLHNIPIEDTPRLRQEHERRERAIAWGVAAIALVLVLVLSAVSTWALRERSIAQEAQQREKLERDTAELRRLEAERSRDEAKRQTVLGAWRSAARQAVLAGHDHTDDDQAGLLAAEALRLYARTPDQPKYPVEEALQFFASARLISHVLATAVDDVRTVDLSPDGNWVAAGGLESPVRIWNLRQPGSPPRTIGGLGEGAAVAFAPDNRQLASSDHGGIRLWTIPWPNSHPRILRNEVCGPPTSLRFSLDGNQLAAADANASAACVWNLREPNAPPVMLEGRQSSVAFSPDGSRLATVEFPSRAVLVWELARPSHPEIILSGHEVYEVAFSYDGIHLAGAGSDRVWIWDLQQPDAPPQFLPGQLNMTSVAYSRNGNWLAAGGDKNVWIWDLHQPKSPPLVLTGHQRSLWSLSFALNGNRLVSSSQDTIRVWDLSPPSGPSLVLSGHKNAATSVAFAPDGNRLASVAAYANANRPPDNSIRVWDLRHPGSAIVLEDPHAGVAINEESSVAFSPDGNHLAASGFDGRVLLWDLKTPKTPWRVLHDASEPVAFSPDGSRLATQCAGLDAVCVWDLVSSKAQPLILNGQKGVINSIAFGPDGEHVAASSDDSDTARIWDLRQPGTPEIVSAPHQGGIDCVAFADNGTVFATADHNRSIRIWDLRDPVTPKMVLTGHQSYVKSIVFFRGSDRLASGSWDGTVRIWDLRQPDAAALVISGQRGKAPWSSDVYIASVALSPDGNRVAFGSWDANVRVWPLWSGAADYVCTLVWRNLSMEEWRQFFGDSIPYDRTCPNLPPGRGAPGSVITPSMAGQPR